MHRRPLPCGAATAQLRVSTHILAVSVRDRATPLLHRPVARWTVLCARNSLPHAPPHTRPNAHHGSHIGDGGVRARAAGRFGRRRRRRAVFAHQGCGHGRPLRGHQGGLRILYCQSGGARACLARWWPPCSRRTQTCRSRHVSFFRGCRPPNPNPLHPPNPPTPEPVADPPEVRRLPVSPGGRHRRHVFV